MTQKHYISVILPLKLEWQPCYCTCEKISSGDRVRVKFANKEYIGVVCNTDITPDIDPSKVKDIEAIEADMPGVLPEEIELWKQVAEYYMCTVGEVYKAAYPAIKVNIEHARAEARKRVCQRRARALAAIDARLDKLHDRLEKKEQKATGCKDGTKTKAACLADIEKIKEEIYRTEIVRNTAVENLQAAEEGRTTEFREMLEDTVLLSDAQQKAYEEILGIKGKPVLLHGVTGAGKTEIYIKLAHKALHEGKNVLYMVPEIALSRQLEARLYHHFGERLITFHSGESAASRQNSAEIIRSLTSREGNYLALCTRSGLFLPHHNLGLIIVDEEHDSSYKQDSPAPRYNGRDTALMMSRIHKGCSIVLGSATPSLEEIYNTRTGRHALVTLSERYHGDGQTEIEIIDTKAERKKRGMIGNISRKLLDHMKRTLEAKEQILILRSRRAWATALQCDECGEIQKCPHCNVSMSLHKTNGHMVCHSCGHATPYSGQCRKCSGKLTPLGAGTQKIEEEISALFPNAVTARLDSDSSQQEKTIKAFAKGEIDILVGTQMIGKGFDFSNLSLVAVIAADSMLGIQDFRADEKAFHLLEQFGGRCGRRGRKGTFVIQTSQPEHPIYANLSGRAYEDFQNTLLDERKDFGFPPYSRIIEITVKDRFEDRAERISRWLGERLARFNVIGPYTPAVDMIADMYIRSLRICLPKDRMLTTRKRSIRDIISDFEKSRKYNDHITIDVDPS